MKKDYIKIFKQFDAEINFSTSQAEDAHDTLAKCASQIHPSERDDEVVKKSKSKKLPVNNFDNMLEDNNYLQLNEPPSNRHRLIDITDLQYYREKFDYFMRKDIYSYSITISPKTSPLLKNKSLKQQSILLTNAIKSILGTYEINYCLTYEDYADRENLHLHGFITLPRLDDISKLKRELRTYFQMPPLKTRARDAFSKIDPCGYDMDSKNRWLGYCIKQMRYSIEQGWTPFFRIDDKFKISNTLRKPKLKKDKMITIEEVPQCFINIKDYEPQNELEEYNNSPHIEIESEADTTEDEMDEETKKEYAEYIRLSNKFNKYSKNMT